MNKCICTPAGDWLAKGRQAIQIEIEGLETVKANLDESFVSAVELLAACKGRVIITGLGKSGLVGRKLAATLSSTGTASFYLHPVEGAHGDLGMIREEDVVVSISNSGETDELNAVLPSMRSLGVSVISLTGGVTSTMARLSDIVINTGVPKEACPLDLAPTSSTTATIAIGDALAACLIEAKAFTAADFKRYHPGGALGQRLTMSIDALILRESDPVVRQETPLADALLVMDKGHLGSVVFTDDKGCLTGILTDGDLRRLICQGELDMKQPSSNIMVKEPYRAQKGSSVAELLDFMEEKEITVLPVVDANGTLCGIVHMHDLLGKGRVKFSR